MSEVEETINRIKTHPSVQGMVIVQNDGSIIRSYYSNEKKEEGENISKSIPLLCAKAKSAVRDLDPTNDLVFFRIKTRAYEIMIAPGFCGKETEYLAGVGWFWGWGWGKWSSMADFKGKCGTTQGVQPKWNLNRAFYCCKTCWQNGDGESIK